MQRVLKHGVDGRDLQETSLDGTSRLVFAGGTSLDSHDSHLLVLVFAGGISLLVSISDI